VPNPSHLLVDTDSLIQVFIARQGDLLAKLRLRCGVIPAVVPEVEGEIRYNQRFRTRFESKFLATVNSGNLVVLEEPEVRKLLLARSVPPSAIDVQLRALDQRCQEYHAHVQEGEAYTHGTAVTLSLPAMSNDGAAISTLLAQGKLVACPTLRFFDLLVFARQRGWIDDATGETARCHLDDEGEHLPPPFRAKASFAGAWGSFHIRLSSDAKHEGLIPASARDTLFLQIT
jgi:hypothetical protein